MKRNTTLRVFALSAIVLGAFSLVASCAQSASSVTGAKYALLYGVEDYPGTGSDLTYTADDAEGMQSLLVSEGVSSSNIIERESSAATKAQIKADILSLATVASDSTVIFYYSGHGTYDDSSAYLCPYDCLDSTGYITTSTFPNLISPAELQSWLAQMGTKNVVVILDSCFSGGFVSSEGATDSSPDNYSRMHAFSAFSTAFSNFGSLLVANASASGDKTPIVLSACGSDEESYDGTIAMGHGVFTYFLLKTAASGDVNSDGFLTTTEAYAYTSSAITSWIKSEGRSQGYPGFLPHLSGDTRDLVLFEN
jgi:uncharacterized caspase-like protein